MEFETEGTIPEEGGRYQQQPHWPPGYPGYQDRGFFDFRRRRRAPMFGPNRSIIVSPLVWGSAVLAGLGALVIYALMLSDCTGSAVGDLWLVRIKAGGSTLDVGYLGMCYGRASHTTFSEDTITIYSQFGIASNSIQAKMVRTGRDIQAEFPIVFAFVMAVLVIFILWTLVMLQSVRMGDPMRMANPGMDMPQVLMTQMRLSWSTWKVMVFVLAVPASVVALGSAWSLSSGTRIAQAVARDLGGGTIELGSTLEAVHWIAASFAVVYLVHTCLLLVEVRRKLGLPGHIEMYYPQMEREPTWEPNPEEETMEDA